MNLILKCLIVVAFVYKMTYNSEFGLVFLLSTVILLSKKTNFAVLCVRKRLEKMASSIFMEIILKELAGLLSYLYPKTIRITLLGMNLCSLIFFLGFKWLEFSSGYVKLKSPLFITFISFILDEFVLRCPNWWLRPRFWGLLIRNWDCW